MKTSDSIDQIAPAILAAQRLIGNAAKDARNPHFKNTYATLAAVIEAVKEPLNKNGIAIIQGLGETVNGVLQVTTRLLHTSGQWVESTSSSPLQKSDPQGVGSATTYLRRYSLAALLCITQEDDDGEAARTPAQVQNPALNSVQVKRESGFDL